MTSQPADLVADETESAIQADIRLALGRHPRVRLFRNNQGVGWVGRVLSNAGGTAVLRGARRVKFMLAPGASDLIGLTQITITPAMVGQTLAVFTALEVKRPGEAVPPHQQNFVDFVRRFGGRAAVVRSVEDARAVVGDGGGSAPA